MDTVEDFSRLKTQEIFIIPHWVNFCTASRVHKKYNQHSVLCSARHYIESFKKPMTAETNEFFSLLVLHFGFKYLQPDGSRENSLWRGWLRSARNDWAFLKDLTLQHTLTVPCSWLLFLIDNNPNQQKKRKDEHWFNKTRIKHFHKSLVNIKTTKFTIKIHALVSFLADSIHMKVKTELVINSGAEIFLVVNDLDSLVVNDHRREHNILQKPSVLFVANSWLCVTADTLQASPWLEKVCSLLRTVPWLLH